MNRPDMYMKRLAGQAAWLRAQGDEEGAALADDLADRLHDRHEGVDDQTAPEWANGPDVEVDNEPDIRCSPAVGVIFPNNEGEMILTIDMCDGGDVAVVHMGDVVRWVESRARTAENQVDSLARKLPYMAPEVRQEWPADLLAKEEARWQELSAEAPAPATAHDETLGEGWATGAAKMLDDIAERMSDAAADDDEAHDLATDLARVLRERHGAVGDTWVEHIPARSGEDDERAAHDATVGSGYEAGDTELDGEAEQAELDMAEWEPLHDDAQEDL